MRTSSFRPLRGLTRTPVHFAALALLGLVSGDQSAGAQPPGGAAEKVIRAKYASTSGSSTADDVAALISTTAAGYTSTGFDGRTENRADFIEDMHYWLHYVGQTIDDHQVIETFRWWNGKSIVTMDEDLKTTMFRWGLFNPFEEKSVTRDTWTRVHSVWMKQNTVWLSDKAWMDGQLQKRRS